ncbi:MAG: hypothetical protein EA361_04340 [Bacteroidetes bacterium]|nr:MAG: hypothetical protein EA361_04340 [Bacteroidota bacterium]
MHQHNSSTLKFTKMIQTPKSGLRSILIIFLSMLVFSTACEKDQTPPVKTDIHGVAYDAITFASLEGAVVTILVTGKSGQSNSEWQTNVGAEGEFVFKEIPVGTYDMYIEHEDYKQMFSNNIGLTVEGAFVAFLPATKDLEYPIGGITGIVTNTDGTPLPNANVAISAQLDSITNGYFASVTTNKNGQFFIGAVPLQSTQEFKVRCIAERYEPQTLQNINILNNEMIVMHVIMEEEEPSDLIFYEGFEGEMTGWNNTGFWHVHQNTEIYNSAYPDYVKLAPNDYSAGRIPNAYKGSRMAWYGEAEAGNFMGDQSPNDTQLSGGTSVSPNNGVMISPVINLWGHTEASLHFWSWFEIESVNPNQYGYDKMEISVLNSNGETKLLGKLNPYIDPIIPERRAIPYTSGGFNQAPVWKYETFDLSHYAGTAIRLKFSFDTRDALYNGFRGWFIDEISIIDRAVNDTKSNFDPSQPLMERSTY